MKEINLLSIVQAAGSLNSELTEKYLNYFGSRYSSDELRDLGILVIAMKAKNITASNFDSFYYGYKIPQISKEFDLLRFGEQYNINIELKSESTFEKIEKQLERNKYYLSFLNPEVYNFTFVSSTGKLYALKSQGLEESNIAELIDLIENQNVRPLISIDSIFNPSNYLVSPFNSTRKFIYGKYFLTHQQEEIKRNILSIISKDGHSFVSVCGKAGTGKTLLTYDIVRDLKIRGLKVLVVHCGKINDGQNLLNSTYGWEIIAIKYLSTVELQNYDLIVLDEVQRIWTTQLDSLIRKVISKKLNCIFSYDVHQCLRKEEINNNISKIIEDKTQSVVYTLNEKIRTNKEVATFIKALFDLSYPIHKIDRTNISLKYFDNYMETKDYLEYLDSQDWKVINLTSSTKTRLPYDNFALDLNDNAHDVIGQEYDNVVAVMDAYFHYKGNELSTNGYKYQPYYHPTKMLFQIMTRTRKKLQVIVINNPIIFERCLKIIG